MSTKRIRIPISAAEKDASSLRAFIAEHRSLLELGSVPLDAQVVRQFLARLEPEMVRALGDAAHRLTTPDLTPDPSALAELREALRELEEAQPPSAAARERVRAAGHQVLTSRWHKLFPPDDDPPGVPAGK